MEGRADGVRDYLSEAARHVGSDARTQKSTGVGREFVKNKPKKEALIPQLKDADKKSNAGLSPIVGPTS